MTLEEVKKPRRKFHEGDVVCYSGRCWELIEDETDEGYLYMGCGPAISTKHVSVVQLVCAVETRADRKEGEV